jgi:SAM-dependent methyltransferase
MLDLPTSPAVARNRDPILEALRPRLPPSGLVLEIAAGAGEHAVHFATAFPQLQWRPSDADAEARAIIAARRDRDGPPNLLPPLPLDASQPSAWPLAHADAIVCINMIHISPWTASQGLMEGAGRLLPPDGALLLYGPYLEPEVETARSNLAFDASLKARNPAWGLRRLDEVSALARQHGLILGERIALPANNLFLAFRKTATATAAA